MKRKLLSILFALVITITSVAPAYADEEEDLRDAKAYAEEQLYDTQCALEELSMRQLEVQSQIDDINKDIVDLIIQIDQTKMDIETTQGWIDETTGQIENTQKDITASEKKLKAVEKQRDKQYQDMKKRIQYIYENGGSVAWATAVLASKDFASFMNKSEYASELHDADRAALQKYVSTLDEVETIKATLESQKTQQEAQKADLEGQKNCLQIQQASLEEQNNELNAQLEDRKAADAYYDYQIDVCYEQADMIEELIWEMDERLEEIEEEKRAIAAAEAAAAAAEEEARRAMEEAQAQAEAAAAEAAQQQAAAEAAQQAALDAQSQAQAQAEAAAAEAQAQAQAAQDAQQAAAEEAAAAAAQAQAEAEAAQQAAAEAAQQAAAEAEAQAQAVAEAQAQAEQASAAAAQIQEALDSGNSIVDYANQFVGNPYVWGGNSLTSGIDCSHFVWQVLQNTGNYSGDYRTSGEWASAGEPVSSLDEAQAGDVIVYSGHVALYDGNGGIVEAKGSAYGITHDRAADCKSIVAIRRFT